MGSRGRYWRKFELLDGAAGRFCRAHQRRALTSRAIFSSRYAHWAFRCARGRAAFSLAILCRAVSGSAHPAPHGIALQQGLAFTADVFAASISLQAPLQQAIARALSLDDKVRKIPSSHYPGFTTLLFFACMRAVAYRTGAYGSGAPARSIAAASRRGRVDGCPNECLQCSAHAERHHKPAHNDAREEPAARGERHPRHWCAWAWTQNPISCRLARGWLGSEPRRGLQNLIALRRTFPSRSEAARCAERAKLPAPARQTCPQPPSRQLLPLGCVSRWSPLPSGRPSSDAAVLPPIRFRS